MFTSGIFYIMIDATKKMVYQSRIKSYCCKKDHNRNNEFDKIVKFLIAQKDALDYAGLN